MNVVRGKGSGAMEMLEGVGETPERGFSEAGAEQNTPPVLGMVPLHWQRVVRIAWVTLALLYVGLFVAALAFRYARIASLTTTALGQGQWSSATTTLTPSILRDALPRLASHLVNSPRIVSRSNASAPPGFARSAS